MKYIIFLAVTFVFSAATFAADKVFQGAVQLSSHANTKDNSLFLKSKSHGEKFLKLVEKTAVREISTSELFNLVEEKNQNSEKAIIIDVREESEWQNDPKISTAIHLSKGILERDIEQLIPNTNQAIRVYCSGGFRARLAADTLLKMGYSNVKSLQGGMRAYQAYLNASKNKSD